MRILVTGAAGFIGSHLCEALHARGHSVVGIDNFNDYYPVALKRLNAADLSEQGITVHEADIVTDDLEPVLDGVEVIYHCAAQPGNSAATSLDTYVRNNIFATHRLMEGIRKRPGFRAFINIATSSVYGKNATDDEETPAKPTSPYGVTKLAAEQLALTYWREQGVLVTSLRLFSVYGPRERTDKLFPKLIGCTLEKKPFPLYEGSRDHSRSFTFVEDIMRGFLAVLDNLEKVGGEIFNIGSDIEITTGRGMDIVEGLLGDRPEYNVLPARLGDQLKTHANIGKARRVLGYAPQIAPEEGLRRTVEWYKEKIWRKVELGS